VDIDIAGFDEGRLERITEHLDRAYVRPGKIAGCQTLVARHGHVAYFRSLGCADVERSVPVREDTVWRIYSMTKPITSVALMTLYERARFQLGDPISRFLPDWQSVRVREADGRLVGPERPVTFRDVLTHTAGLSYGRDPDEHPVDRLYAEAGLREPGLTLESLTRTLAGLPLKFHPGTRWHYSFATDVCAHLVEVISGRSFDDYLREVIFEPLGMADTGFVVRPGALDRFAANYNRTADKSLELFDDPRTSAYLEPRPMLSGGGGLASTAPDYLRFCEMLRRGGELDGSRVLGERTVRFMARNHLPGGVTLGDFAIDRFGDIGAGTGFGLGFAVVADPVELQSIASAGEYSWGGAASTLFWVDPVEDVVVIFMTQLMPAFTFDFRKQLRQLVHQALVG
jgi:CubicO group peptidase (beta-lactamase class C family)